MMVGSLHCYNSLPVFLIYSGTIFVIWEFTVCHMAFFSHGFLRFYCAIPGKSRKEKNTRQIFSSSSSQTLTRYHDFILDPVTKRSQQLPHNNAYQTSAGTVTWLGLIHSLAFLSDNPWRTEREKCRIWKNTKYGLLISSFAFCARRKIK